MPTRAYCSLPLPPLSCTCCCPLPRVAPRSLETDLRAQGGQVGPTSHELSGWGSAAVPLQGWRRQLGQHLLPALARSTSALWRRARSPWGSRGLRFEVGASRPLTGQGPCSFIWHGASQYAAGPSPAFSLRPSVSTRVPGWCHSFPASWMPLPLASFSASCVSRALFRCPLGRPRAGPHWCPVQAPPSALNAPGPPPLAFELCTPGLSGPQFLFYNGGRKGLRVLGERFQLCLPVSGFTCVGHPPQRMGPGVPLICAPCVTSV